MYQLESAAQTAALSSLPTALLSWQAGITPLLIAQTKNCHDPAVYPKAPTETSEAPTNSFLFPCCQRTSCTCFLLLNPDKPPYFVSFPAADCSSLRACGSRNAEAASAGEEVAGRTRSCEVRNEASLESSPR